MPGICASVGAATLGGLPPSPSLDCENCQGRGKVGDGTIEITCPVCNGTGKSRGAESNGKAGAEPGNEAAAPEITNSPLGATEPGRSDTPRSGPVVWFTDFAQAEAESLRTGKPLLVYFTFAGCGPCARLGAFMDAELKNHPDILLCRIDGQQAGMRFGVNRWPWHWVRVHGRTVQSWKPSLSRPVYRNEVGTAIGVAQGISLRR
jgi:hypothetical protein